MRTASDLFDSSLNYEETGDHRGVLEEVQPWDGVEDDIPCDIMPFDYLILPSLLAEGTWVLFVVTINKSRFVKKKT